MKPFDQELKPGDVLLSLGDSEISKAIKQLDDGPYSHAALWTGEEVIESTFPKVRHCSLEESCRGGERPRLYVDVYRHEGLSESDAKVLVDRAGEYLGQQYPAGDLLLACMLLRSAAFIPSRHWQHVFIMGLCGDYSAAPNVPLDEVGAVVCTQLVAECYAHVGMPITFHPHPPGSPNVEQLLKAWEELRRKAGQQRRASTLDDSPVDPKEWPSLRERLAKRLGLDPSRLMAASAQRGSAPPHVAGGADGNWDPRLVTPRHLQNGFGFRWVSRIYEYDQHSGPKLWHGPASDPPGNARTTPSSGAAVADAGVARAAPVRVPAPKLNILYVPSQSTTQDHLELKGEFDQIEHVLYKVLRSNERFSMNTDWAHDSTEVFDQIDEYEPNVVHFSGHGTRSGELTLVSAGEDVPVTSGDLAANFKDACSRVHVRCVFLNACYSAEAAKQIAEHVDCVIGMASSVPDEAAIHFAKEFYRRVARGASIYAAYETAKTRLPVHLRQNSGEPQVFWRLGVEPGKLVLFEPRRRQKPATVLLWAVLGLISAFSLPTITAVAWKWPCTWADVLGVGRCAGPPQPVANIQPPQPVNMNIDRHEDLRACTCIGKKRLYLNRIEDTLTFSKRVEFYKARAMPEPKDPKVKITFLKSGEPLNPVIVEDPIKGSKSALVPVHGNTVTVRYEWSRENPDDKFGLSVKSSLPIASIKATMDLPPGTTVGEVRPSPEFQAAGCGCDFRTAQDVVIYECQCPKPLEINTEYSVDWGWDVYTRGGC